MVTTMRAMRMVASRRIWNWPWSLAALICAPRPRVCRVWFFEVEVLSDDAGVPRAAGGGDQAGDEVGEDAGKDDGLPALDCAEAEEGGDLAQVGGDGHGAGDDVEEDVPLGAEEHQAMEPMPMPPPNLISASSRTGKSAVAGTEAAICARGWAMRASFGCRPMATPTGMVQSAARASEKLTRR